MNFDTITDIHSAFRAHSDLIALFLVRGFAHYKVESNQLVAEEVLRFLSLGEGKAAKPRQNFLLMSPLLAWAQPTGLVAAYTFNEGSGTTVAAYFGNNNRYSGNLNNRRG